MSLLGYLHILSQEPQKCTDIFKGELSHRTIGLFHLNLRVYRTERRMRMHHNFVRAKRKYCGRTESHVRDKNCYLLESLTQERHQFPSCRERLHRCYLLARLRRRQPLLR